MNQKISVSAVAILCALAVLPACSDSSKPAAGSSAAKSAAAGDSGGPVLTAPGGDKVEEWVAYVQALHDQRLAVSGAYNNAMSKYERSRTAMLAKQDELKKAGTNGSDALKSEADKLQAEVRDLDGALQTAHKSLLSLTASYETASKNLIALREKAASSAAATSN